MKFSFVAAAMAALSLSTLVSANTDRTAHARHVDALKMKRVAAKTTFSDTYSETTTNATLPFAQSLRREVSSERASAISPNLVLLTHRVRPVSGKRYFVRNVAKARWLNDAYGYTYDGATIIAWPKDLLDGDNEEWLFTEGTGGSFTLRSRSAMNKTGGGYMALQDGKGVITQTPTSWTIKEVSDRAYKFTSAGNVALAAVTTDVDVRSAQVQAIPENSADESQQWIFVEAPRPKDCQQPVSDREYFITNVGRARWLDLPNTGNIVIAWYKNDEPTANQVWRATVFDGGKLTFQNVQALREAGFPYGNGGGTGGHLHIQGGKTLVAPEPFYWKIVDTGDKMYKLKPFDAADANNALTAVTDALNPYALGNNQAVLEKDAGEDETQYWGFIPVIDGVVQ